MQRRLSVSLVIMLFAGVVIFFARQTPPFILIESFIQKVLQDPLVVLYSFKNSTSPDEKSENFRLKDQNQKLVERLVEFERLKKDNIALRSQFEQQDQNIKKLLPARVLGFTGKSLAPDALIIDKGENDGIKVGLATISGKNLIGKIDTIGKSFSKIALVTNASFSTVGITVDTQSQGVVQGEDDFIIFTNVSIKDTLKKDDVVVTVGDVNAKGIGIPPDYVIGKISEINKSESKPTQNSQIKPVLHFSKLTLVFIVLP